MRAEPRFKPLPLEAATLLAEGRVVDAIEVVRKAEGLGMRKARHRIDAHIAQDPILGVQLVTLQRARRRKFFLWFLFVDLALTAGIIYWFFYRGSA